MLPDGSPFPGNDGRGRVRAFAPPDDVGSKDSHSSTSKAPRLLPTGDRHGSDCLRPFVEVEMVVSGTWLASGASGGGGLAPAVSHSHNAALLRSARRAGTAVASPELHAERSKAGVVCHPEAQPPAESVAGRVAGSSSDGSSPADLPGHEVRGVAR